MERVRKVTKTDGPQENQGVEVEKRKAKKKKAQVVSPTLASVFDSVKDSCIKEKMG